MNTANNVPITDWKNAIEDARKFNYFCSKERNMKKIVAAYRQLSPEAISAVDMLYFAQDGPLDTQKISDWIEKCEQEVNRP